MTDKKKTLFVCTINRMRSTTAHEIFKNDTQFEVDSAGTDSGASKVLTQELLDLADSIVVMEKHHRNDIRNRFPDTYKP